MSRIEAYGRFMRVPTPEERAPVQAAVDRLLEVRKAIAAQEEALARLATEERDLVTKTIPQALDQLQVGTVPLERGSVTVVDSFAVSPKKENRDAAVRWAKEAGGEPLVARTLTVDLPRGTDPAPVSEAIMLAGFAPTVTESIHPSTLRAFVSDMIEQGRKVPEDLLGVFRLREAVVTEPVFDGE